jgi:Protein of unknown function (DUF3800)
MSRRRRIWNGTAKSFFAYADETGNSGLNLFDEHQPEFWIGTLICETDLDALDPSISGALRSRAGAPELHGNHLGLSGVEKIAGKLKTQLMRTDAQFFFVRIDKQHYATLKFTDTILDSGLNHAVSPMLYGLRISRLYFAQIFSALMDESENRAFWRAYLDGTASELGMVSRTVLEKVKHHVPDPRTRQLLIDALRWAADHPERLLEGPEKELAAPNIAALTILIDILHSHFGETPNAITRFVHDEQQQFGKALQIAFDVSKRYTSVRGRHPLSFASDIKSMQTFVGSMVSKSSRDSLGLQVLDVALWLIKRFHQAPDSIHGMCLELAEFIAGKSFISSMTHERLVDEVIAGFEHLESQPFTPTMEQDGRRLVQQFEEARIARMRGGIGLNDDERASLSPGSD